MSERNDSGAARPADRGEARDEADLGAAPKEQAGGPEKRHGDALLEGNGSRHGADAGVERRD